MCQSQKERDIWQMHIVYRSPKCWLEQCNHVSFHIVYRSPKRWLEQCDHVSFHLATSSWSNSTWGLQGCLLKPCVRVHNSVRKVKRLVNYCSYIPIVTYFLVICG